MHRRHLFYAQWSQLLQLCWMSGHCTILLPLVFFIDMHWRVKPFQNIWKYFWNMQLNQNRRQKFFNRGVLRFCEDALGLWRGALHSKNWQKRNWFIVSHVSICGDLELCLVGLSPPNPPCGDGTGCMWDMKVNSSAAINLIAQQLWWSICPFWTCLPYAPDFRKTFSHFGQGWLCGWKLPWKFHVST